MTDPYTAIDYAAAYARLEAEQTERLRLAAEALAPNKTALFDGLVNTGITSVVVAFDGSGDSGQIESIDARSGDQDIDLPGFTIELVTPTWNGTALERRTLPIAEAIEEVVYGLLRDTHPGWEVNDGAYGEFTFDVSQRGITLDHNSRYTAVDTSAHRW